MAVAIVTDSAAALPGALVERFDITVVPMWLTVDGESVREGDLSLSELLAHDRVTTSGPTPGEFETAVKERARGSSILTMPTSTSAPPLPSHRAQAMTMRATACRTWITCLNWARG